MKQLAPNKSHLWHLAPRSKAGGRNPGQEKPSPSMAVYPSGGSAAPRAAWNVTCQAENRPSAIAARIAAMSS